MLEDISSDMIQISDLFSWFIALRKMDWLFFYSKDYNINPVELNQRKVKLSVSSNSIYFSCSNLFQGHVERKVSDIQAPPHVFNLAQNVAFHQEKIWLLPVWI